MVELTVFDLDRFERQKSKRRIAEDGGNERQSGIATNFPKNPPPSGLAYSKNFARAQKGSQFAVQVRG